MKRGNQKPQTTSLRARNKLALAGPSTLVVLVALFASGCDMSASTFSSVKAGGATTGVSGSGAMAAQVIFSTAPLGSVSPPAGSFSASSVPANGTAPGSGLAAVNLFNADGSQLAAGTSDPNWPHWLNSVVIGVSGSTNTAATNSHCATFAGSTEATTANCNLGNGDVSCGAPSGQFRVSEVDCGYGTPPTTGTGGGNDGIYIQANINRNYLGTTENLMVVMNYMASTYNSAPANPQNCFSQSGFSASLCSDFLWQMYMKHSANEVVQPFMMLVPPIYNYYSNNPSNTNGNTPTTKQYIVPIAADAGLNTIQFSRVGSTLNSSSSSNTGSAYLTACDISESRTGSGANTPLCAGIIFYSMTLFRI